MDFNDDTRLDLVVGERYGAINYFTRLPNGTLTEEPDIIANGSAINVGYNSAPQVIDWDEDGLLDLITGNDTAPERIRLYLNSGTPSNYLFTTYTELQYTNSAYISYSRCNPHVTDLNNDGKKDLVIGEDFGHIYYLENVNTNSDPEFSTSVMVEANGAPISFPSGYTDLKVWADDWNEDGTKDLVVGNYDDSVHLYIAYPLGIEEEQSQQERFAISVAPNPTCNKTTIHYLLTDDVEVRLSVYDIQGSLIETLVSGYQTAGTYNIIWDGSDSQKNTVPAGVYFYKLSLNGVTHVDKLVVLR